MECLHPWEMTLPISSDELQSCVNHLFLMTRDNNRNGDLLGPINRKIIPIVCFNSKLKPKLSGWPNNISVIDHLDRDSWEGKIRFSASPKQDDLLLAKGFNTTVTGIQIPKNDKQAVFEFFSFAMKEVSRWDVKSKLRELGLDG